MRKHTITIALALLLLNSAYLWAFAHATIFYMANALLHLALGVALTLLAIPLLKHYPKEAGLFIAAALPGIYIAIRGNTLDHRWALLLHIAPRPYRRRIHRRKKPADSSNRRRTHPPPRLHLPLPHPPPRPPPSHREPAHGPPLHGARRRRR